MGNAFTCLDKAREARGNLCLGDERGIPKFLPPNDKHVTFSFDYLAKGGANLWPGTAGELTDAGYSLGEQTGERRTIRWETVHDCRRPAQLKICVSGRARIYCPEHLMLSGGEETSGALAFRICTRGLAVFESLRTQSFTHTAHVVTSGVYFSLGVQRILQGILLCARITLLLSTGEEVSLVEDRLGPLKAPQEFYLDFSVVDVQSRNLQLDLIVRGQEEQSGVAVASDSGKATTGKGGTWTLRTCLQEYTTFNSQADPSRICLATADFGSLICNSSAHLQNLVISEELVAAFQEAPSPSVKEAILGKVLFRGSEVASEKYAPTSNADSFWHHVRYGPNRSSLPGGGTKMGPNPLKGEFWVSKDIIDRGQIYLSITGTVAQALLGCVILRFTCPIDYVSLIENEAASLRETHIPSRGIVLGIEQDPRHGGLLRMFIEHNNEILEDIVVCEFKADKAYETEVKQEVYDSGDVIFFRVTVQYQDGTEHSAELRLATDQLEDPDQPPSGAFRQFDEPSWRFPIAPCQRRNMLSTGHRIFFYSSVAFQEEKAITSAERDEGEESAGEEQLLSAYASPAISAREPAMEDWQSVGGGNSDCEDSVSVADAQAHAMVTSKVPCLWKRPFLESMLLVSEVEVKPW
mmetsp:Transcript_1210/g.2463  ORF Transcript_1210/g.2463 Transcript_1210/m.2463 type:complete len:637 (+) Transcript_1210:64-1974(+)